MFIVGALQHRRLLVDGEGDREESAGRVARRQLWWQCCHLPAESGRRAAKGHREAAAAASRQTRYNAAGTIPDWLVTPQRAMGVFSQRTYFLVYIVCNGVWMCIWSVGLLSKCYSWWKDATKS